MVDLRAGAQRCGGSVVVRAALCGAVGGGGGAAGSIGLYSGHIQLSGTLDAGGGLGGTGFTNFGSGGFGGGGCNGGGNGGNGGTGGDGGNGGTGGDGYIRAEAPTIVNSASISGHYSQSP